MKRPPCLVVTILASMVGIVAPSNTSAVRGGRGIHHASDDGLSDEYHKPKDIPSIRTVPVSPASATAADRSNLEGRLHAVQEVLGHRPHPSYLDQTMHYYPTKQSNDGRHQHQRQRSLNHPAGRIMRNLVLLLRFSDHVGRTLPSRIDVWRLYNYDATDPFAGYVDDIVPTGSVRQLYEFNSHSTFTVETTVVDWITLSKPESYYGNGDSGFTKFKEAIIEALTILDSGVGGFDFTNFDLDENGALDGFGVLHSGYGAEYGGDDCHGAPSDDRIWSHKGGIDWTSSQEAGSGDAGAVNRFYASSSLRGVCNSNIVRMGVIVHELGHYLGLPDLYDETFDGSGLGAYDFMSQSWGLDGSGMYPPTLSAWSKVRLGWAKVEVIAYDGTYRLESSASSNTVYKIEAGYPEGEYLLIENRQPTRYDRMMEGGGGLAIYHIDDKVGDQNSRGFPSPQSDWPIDGRHYQVALLAADGKYDLERGTNQGDSGDLWHSGSALKELRSGSASYPNTDSYQSGNVTPTGVRIYGFGDSGNLMTFRVAGLGMREAGGGSTDGIAVSLESIMTPIQTPKPRTPKPVSKAPLSPPPTRKPVTKTPTKIPSRMPVAFSITSSGTPSPKPVSKAPLSPPPTPTPVMKTPTKIPSKMLLFSITSSRTPPPSTRQLVCADLCLEEIASSDCPSTPYDMPDCVQVRVGALCEANGECGSNQTLNNCPPFDVYRRIGCHVDSDSSVTNETTVTSSILETSGIVNSDVNHNNCPYYPGWYFGLSFCLNDCRQPEFMISNPSYEFDSIESCCTLHYEGKSSCMTEQIRLNYTSR